MSSHIPPEKVLDFPATAHFCRSVPSSVPAPISAAPLMISDCFLKLSGMLEVDGWSKNTSPNLPSPSSTSGTTSVCVCRSRSLLGFQAGNGPKNKSKTNSPWILRGRKVNSPSSPIDGSHGEQLDPRSSFITAYILSSHIPTSKEDSPNKIITDISSFPRIKALQDFKWKKHISLH